MKIWIHEAIPEIEEIYFCDKNDRHKIQASISSRDITKSMVRTKSSNIWSYAINVRDTNKNVGDVYIIFKNKNGGPEPGPYVYYDIPTQVYRKFVGAPSKGHFFWANIRNRYRYSKLFGDKRGKLKNAVNNI